MALYEHEEICKGCENAVFHECCGKFCKCLIGEDKSVNACQGTCVEHSIYKGKRLREFKNAD